jgi:hypothetical protein
MFRKLFVPAVDDEVDPVDNDYKSIQITPTIIATSGRAKEAWFRAATKAEELSSDGIEIINFEMFYDFNTYTLYGYFIYYRERETPA